jgi:hypothetical protein
VIYGLGRSESGRRTVARGKAVRDRGRLVGNYSIVEKRDV